MLTRPAGLDPVRLFSRFDLAARPSAIAAVSGGSDSTALLLLLDDYLRRFAPGTRLLAVTVDHALRPASAGEAAAVSALCAKLNIEHSIRTWTGDKPQTGLPEAAREARHELLAQAARDAGTDLVFTGHTIDDQAETVLMRQARKSGRGLAGIAPTTLFDGGTWIVRPLLAERRTDLREYLRRRDTGWIDDPTNLDDRFERPRIRKTLRAGEGHAAALATSRHATNQRIALGEAATRFIRDHATRPSPGLLRLDRDAFARTEPDVAVYALRILLAAAGGASHLPDEERTTALHGELLASGPVRAVLSRTLIDARTGSIFLLREARDLPRPAAAEPGALWDGRYRVPAGYSRSIRSIGERDAAASSADPPIPGSLVRAALSREPDGNLVPIVAPWNRYLPSFDLAPARAVAALLGAAEIPLPPFPEHIAAKP